NGWAKDVCALAEHLFWVDFDKRVKSTGTAIGLTESSCLQTMWEDRLALATEASLKQPVPLGAKEGALADQAVRWLSAMRGRAVLAQLHASTEFSPRGDMRPREHGGSTEVPARA